MADQDGLTQGDAGQDADRFRATMGTLPAGVAVVTAVDDGEPVGVTVASLTMLSADPPLVGFLIGKTSTSFPRIRRAGAFCANILTASQEDISNGFAMKSGPDRFAGLSWRPAAGTGSPVLEGVAAWIDCRVADVHEPGDHLLVIGEAVGFDAGEGEAPLVFQRHRYTALQGN